MMKYILILFCIIALGFLNATTADTLTVPQKTLPEAGNAFMQFSTLMNWFILALLLISIISIIRSIIVRNRNIKNKDKPNPDFRNPQPPKNVPPKKSAFSLPMIIMLILMVIIIFHIFSTSGTSITKESYTNFMARVANGQ